MRKLTGLCFLTATLFASLANAQSIFIDKGDPTTMGVTLGGFYGSPYGGSLNVAASYRGVVDMGIEFTGTHFKSGDLAGFNALNFMPFMNWHILRSDADEFPISVALTVGVEKIIFFNSAPYTSPSGWGVLAGGSLYRQFELSSSIMFIPEVFLAYEYTDRRTYHALSPADSNGYKTTTTHSGRGVLRVNFGFKKGGHVYTVTPYAGYQGNDIGAVGGLTLGMVF